MGGKEGGRERGWEEGREGRREGGKKGGRERRRERREGGKEGVTLKRDREYVGKYVKRKGEGGRNNNIITRTKR